MQAPDVVRVLRLLPQAAHHARGAAPATAVADQLLRGRGRAPRVVHLLRTRVGESRRVWGVPHRRESPHLLVYCGVRRASRLN